MKFKLLLLFLFFVGATSLPNIYKRSLNNEEGKAESETLYRFTTFLRDSIKYNPKLYKNINVVNELFQKYSKDLNGNPKPIDNKNQYVKSIKQDTNEFIDAFKVIPDLSSRTTDYDNAFRLMWNELADDIGNLFDQINFDNERNKAYVKSNFMNILNYWNHAIQYRRDSIMRNNGVPDGKHLSVFRQHQSMIALAYKNIELRSFNKIVPDKLPDYITQDIQQGIKWFHILHDFQALKNYKNLIRTLKTNLPDNSDDDKRYIEVLPVDSNGESISFGGAPAVYSSLDNPYEIDVSYVSSEYVYNKNNDMYDEDGKLVEQNDHSTMRRLAWRSFHRSIINIASSYINSIGSSRFSNNFIDNLGNTLSSLKKSILERAITINSLPDIDVDQSYISELNNRIQDFNTLTMRLNEMFLSQQNDNFNSARESVFSKIGYTKQKVIKPLTIDAGTLKTQAISSFEDILDSLEKVQINGIVDTVAMIRKSSSNPKASNAINNIKDSFKDISTKFRMYAKIIETKHTSDDDFKKDIVSNNIMSQTDYDTMFNIEHQKYVGKANINENMAKLMAVKGMKDSFKKNLDNAKKSLTMINQINVEIIASCMFNSKTDVSELDIDVLNAINIGINHFNDKPANDKESKIEIPFTTETLMKRTSVSVLKSHAKGLNKKLNLNKRKSKPLNKVKLRRPSNK